MAKSKRDTTIKEATEGAGLEVIQMLRSIVAPEGKKGNWMKHLSDKQLVEIYQRLRLGQKPRTIVRKVVQDQWGIQTKTTTDSLARAVKRLRELALPELQKHGQKHDPESDPEEAKMLTQRGKRIVEKLDALGTLRWMVEEQLDRIQMLRGTEKKTKFALQETNKIMSQVRETLHTILDTEMKLGLVDVKPSEHNLNISASFDGMMDHVVSGDGAVLLSAIGKLMASVREGGNVMDMRRDKNDDGAECFVLSGGKGKQIECEELKTDSLRENEVALLLNKKGAE